LKAIAKTPEIPALQMAVSVHEESKEVEWNGAVLYPVSGNAMSAFGVSLSETALAVKSVASGSKAERIGLQVKDLLWEVNGVRIKQVSQLEKCSSGDDIMVVRSQQTLHLKNE
jgi:S1-C subfamily serine protease